MTTTTLDPNLVDQPFQNPIQFAQGGQFSQVADQVADLAADGLGIVGIDALVLREPVVQAVGFLDDAVEVAQGSPHGRLVGGLVLPVRVGGHVISFALIRPDARRGIT